MTDEPYTNLDLDTAESILVAAGSVEQAKAMRQYTQGIRNFLQSEFGQSFLNAYETISEKQTVRILTEVALRLDSITELVQQSIAIARDAHTTGKEALAIAKAGAARLKKLETQTSMLKQGQAEYNARLDAVIARLDTNEGRLDRKHEWLDDHDRRILAIEQLLTERPKQRAAEHQALLDAIRQAQGG